MVENVIELTNLKKKGRSIWITSFLHPQGRVIIGYGEVK